MKAKKEIVEQKPPVTGNVCIVCGKPASSVVDGDPSCDEHIELVYEDQLEKYTLQHLTNDDWLEKKA